MLQVAIKLRELASSNLNHLIEKADNPAQMLGLLRFELQESIISAEGALGKARRQAERKVAEADKLAQEAEEWGEKAKLALQHQREDLARSALLVREKDRAQAEQWKQEASDLEAEAEELASTLAALETKLAETRQKIADLPAAGRAGTRSSANDKPSRSEKIMDRIAALEKRTEFAGDGEREVSAASLDAELAALNRDATIEAELALLKDAAKPARKPRSKAKS